MVERTQWAVLVPYKITLLSNMADGVSLALIVLVPYKITLLSNERCFVIGADKF